MADSFGIRIREVRLRYGMSQAELARRIGISSQSMNAIERSHVDLRASHIARIAQVLRVSGDFLLGLCDDDEVSVGRKAAKFS